MKAILVDSSVIPQGSIYLMYALKEGIMCFRSNEPVRHRKVIVLVASEQKSSQFIR